MQTRLCEMSLCFLVVSCGIVPLLPAATPAVSFAAVTDPISQPNNLGLSPVSTIVSDLDHDGKSDIVTANVASDSISVLLGNGDGTFYWFTNYPTAAYNREIGSLLPYTLGVADFDRDTHTDVVTTSTTLFLGRGDGSFLVGRTVEPGFSSTDLAVADLNGDEYVDLVLPLPNSSNIGVFFNDRSGGFYPALVVSAGNEVRPKCVVVSDFNSDGTPDIVTGNNHSEGVFRPCSVSFVAGDGSGNFAAAQVFSEPTVSFGLDINALRVGDFDDDGVLDLATSAAFSGTIQARALHGHGDGTFANFANLGWGYRIGVADLNGDGRSDVVATLGNDEIGVSTSRGGGSFSYAVVSVPGGNALPTLADISGDGRADLVLGSGGNTLGVALNETAPALDIGRVGTNVVLSWPNWAYDLESRSQLADGETWTPSSTPPAVSDGRKAVTNSVDQATGFYRLKQQ